MGRHEVENVISEDLSRLLQRCSVTMSQTFDLDAYVFTPEHSPEYNAARLLCLVGQAPSGRIAGKRKLRLLDYVLRQPGALFKILTDAVARGAIPPEVLEQCHLKHYELTSDSPEHPIIQYPLSIHDPGFDQYLSFLMVRGLITISVEDPSNLNPRDLFAVTKPGRAALGELAESHMDTLARAAALHKVFSSKMAGTTLFTELTQQYPELVIGPRWKEVS